MCLCATSLSLIVALNSLVTFVELTHHKTAPVPPSLHQSVTGRLATSKRSSSPVLVTDDRRYLNAQNIGCLPPRELHKERRRSLRRCILETATLLEERATRCSVVYFIGGLCSEFSHFVVINAQPLLEHN